MEFVTKVQVETLPQPIKPSHSILALGSCFAQAVGCRMAANGFRISVNPAGTLYNPESIAMVLEERWTEPWAQAKGFNWLLQAGKECPGIEPCDYLLITFGTTHVYRLPDGHVVANCHKQPARMFAEEELTVEHIIGRYRELIPRLREKHAGMQMVFTVSPYRYMKYGLHQSALGKARLLLAIDGICRTVEGCHYFPAYEIVTDELRDYRFYEADMVHPSAVAADYVWERFQESCLDAEARCLIREYAPIRRALEHRPLNPDSAEYQAFRQKTEEKRKDILSKYGLL